MLGAELPTYSSSCTADVFVVALIALNAGGAAHRFMLQSDTAMTTT